jgi:hypothetical protein
MVPEKKTSSATRALSALGLEAQQRDLALGFGQRPVLPHDFQGSGTNPPGVVKRQGIPRGDHDVPDPGPDGGAQLAEQPGS